VHFPGLEQSGPIPQKMVTPTICSAESEDYEAGVCYDKNLPYIILYEIIFLLLNGDISLLFECVCGASDRFQSVEW
jgi:hypothetical protein